MQRELEWEKMMQDNGIERYHRACDRALYRTTKTGKRVRSNSESNTTYGISIVKEFVGDVAKYIKLATDESIGKPGAKPIAFEYLTNLDLEVVAFITCKTIIDSISIETGYLSLANRIGQKIEDQFRIMKMEGSLGKELSRKIEKWGKRNRQFSYQKKKQTYMYAEKKYTSEQQMEAWEPWPTKHKQHLGFACIEAFRLTGMISIKLYTIDKKRFYKIKATKECFDWIKANKSVMELVTPDRLPMISKPLEWSTPFNGGYYASLIRENTPLVKSSHIKEIAKVSMPAVYAAVNSLQNVEWKINPFVFDIVKDQFSCVHGIGMPGNEPIQVPECPLGAMPDKDSMSKAEYKKEVERRKNNLSEQDKKDFSNWKMETQLLYKLEEERVSKLMQVTRTMQVVNLLKDKKKLYFVYQLDFRGRLYPCGTGLNPQGGDIEKGLLLFNKGVKLGINGYKHLLYHCAGVYGVDKCTLQERIDWVNKNLDMIVETGNNPLDMIDFWKQADKPYCFLAVCKEISEIIQLYNDKKESYVSHIPCNQDGSCNGIQHYSAMIRDVVGAEAVNLMNSDRPNDIYQTTLNKVKEYLNYAIDNEVTFTGKEWIPASEDELELADIWLNEYNPDRSLTKKPTMLVPYGGSKLTCKEYVAKYMYKEDAKRLQNDSMYVNPFDKIDSGQIKSSVYIHHLIWLSLDTVIIAARKAMKFLVDINKGIQKGEELGRVLRWTTKTGFPVIQDIRDVKTRQIETKLNGKIIKLTCNVSKNKLNEYRMSSSLAPNFTHSNDAAHLMLCVNLCNDLNITDFMPIHDSFGVHAGNVETLHICIRHTFVELHNDNILKQFWLQQVDQHPDKVKFFPMLSDISPGDFNLDEVNKSTHFFR